MSWNYCLVMVIPVSLNVPSAYRDRHCVIRNASYNLCNEAACEVTGI